MAISPWRNFFVDSRIDASDSFRALHSAPSAPFPFSSLWPLPPAGSGRESPRKTKFLPAPHSRRSHRHPSFSRSSAPRQARKRPGESQPAGAPSFPRDINFSGSYRRAVPFSFSSSPSLAPSRFVFPRYFWPAIFPHSFWFLRYLLIRFVTISMIFRGQSVLLFLKTMIFDSKNKKYLWLVRSGGIN